MLILEENFKRHLEAFASDSELFNCLHIYRPFNIIYAFIKIKIKSIYKRIIEQQFSKRNVYRLKKMMRSMEH